MTDSAPPFEEHRDRLLQLAYGMLGRVSVAEDLVQDAYLRWQSVDADSVEDPEAYLSTIVTRLCLDELTSARAEREQYTGPWLPEPVVTSDASPDGSRKVSSRPDAALETTGELSMALLVLLDELRPFERAVYVLRAAFDRPYAEIARLVDRTEAHCRKIAQRARDRIENRDAPIDAPPKVHTELLARFVDALEQRDPEALTKVLAEDVTHYTDGGEVKEATKRPIEGAERVVRFLLSISSKAPAGLRVRPVWVNGRPALLVLESDCVHSVWCFCVVDTEIQELYCVRNPEKLQHLSSGAQSD